MSDEVHPDNRPLTLAEMFQRIAVLADHNHLDKVLMAMDHARIAVELEIDRQRPGYSMDRLMGLVSKDWKEGKRND